METSLEKVDQAGPLEYSPPSRLDIGGKYGMWYLDIKLENLSYHQVISLSLVNVMSNKPKHTHPSPDSLIYHRQPWLDQQAAEVSELSPIK